MYPASLRRIGRQHWTPLHIVGEAARFLAAEDKVRVSGIGSGAGKFCLPAAHYRPDAVYYGIEQRGPCQLCGSWPTNAWLDDVTFRHGDFMQLDMGAYDHFYFFDAFFELASSGEKIDDSIHYSAAQYGYCQHYLYEALEKSPGVPGWQPFIAGIVMPRRVTVQWTAVWTACCNAG